MIGFIDYMQSLIVERYERSQAVFKAELFRVSEDLYASNVIEQARMMLDKTAAYEVFKQIYEKDDKFKMVRAEGF